MPREELPVVSYQIASEDPGKLHFTGNWQLPEFSGDGDLVRNERRPLFLLTVELCVIPSTVVS